MKEYEERDLWMRMRRLERAVAILIGERKHYMQIINDLVSAGTRYDNAVQAKLAADSAEIAQDQQAIASDEAINAQLGQHALTDDEVTLLTNAVGAINTKAAALEAATTAPSGDGSAATPPDQAAAA